MHRHLKKLSHHKVLCPKWQSEAAEHILNCSVKMKSMKMLGLTGTSAMATLFFNKPECECERDKHRRLSHDVFFLLSYQQHLG